MRYHETVPSEQGKYHSMFIEGENPWLRDDGVWFVGYRQISHEKAGLYLPMLGPLPSTNDEAITLACEVAFARMWAKWVKATGWNRHELACMILCERFRDGERSLSLLRDMERVTFELSQLS